MGKLEELMKYQAKNIQKEMYSAIRRGIQQVMNKEGASLGGGGGGGAPSSEMTSQLKEAIQEKASLDDMNLLQSQKANKVDIDMCLRWVDLLHKMVNQVMILITLNFKIAVDMKGQESLNQK
jgi:hypothetical protein